MREHCDLELDYSRVGQGLERHHDNRIRRCPHGNALWRRNPRLDVFRYGHRGTFASSRPYADCGHPPNGRYSVAWLLRFADAQNLFLAARAPGSKRDTSDASTETSRIWPRRSHMAISVESRPSRPPITAVTC